MKKQLMCVFIGIAFSWAEAVAQVPRDCPAQLTLMVVPYSKRGEDLGQKIEADDYYRAAISLISQAFVSRKYSVRDFMEQYDHIKRSQILGPGTQTDPIKMVIENAPVDVLIRAEIFLETTKDGDHQAKLMLNAVDKYSTELYAGSTELMQSSIRRHSDYKLYVQEALKMDDNLTRFCNRLDSAILFVQRNGRTMQVKVELDQNSIWKLDDEINETKEALSDTIEAWIQKNLASGQVRGVGSSDKVLIIEAHVPVLDAFCRSLTPNNFGAELRKYLRNLQIQRGELRIKNTVIGGQIYLKIE
jgi:hypothetical protein